MSRRPRDFYPRIPAIAWHLSAIDKEFSGIGRTAFANNSESRNQLVDAIWPVLNEIIDRLGQGQRLAVDEATNLGNEAIRCSVGLATPPCNRLKPGGQNPAVCRHHGHSESGILDGNRRSPWLGRRQYYLHSGKCTATQ